MALTPTRFETAANWASSNPLLAKNEVAMALPREQRTPWRVQLRPFLMSEALSISWFQRGGKS